MIIVKQTLRFFSFNFFKYAYKFHFLRVLQNTIFQLQIMLSKYFYCHNYKDLLSFLSIFRLLLWHDNVEFRGKYDARHE
jgi:hypothetical protein